MVKPIPKELLIHEVDYEEYKGTGNFGDEWEDSVTIDHVRFEPETKITRDANGEEVKTQGTLFLDAVNTPKFRQMKVNSKVTFDGQEMRVNACDVLYAFDPDTPHHYEVELI